MKNRLVKNKYFYIMVISFILLGLYFIGNKSNVIRMSDNGTVSDNSVIGAYIDGEYSSNIPGKDDGYVVKNIVCDNDATGIWDNDNWGLLTTNMSKKTKCNIYFRKKVTLVDKVTTLSSNDTTNFASDDPDSNIRYIGANPDNYVYFNCSDYSNQSDSTCEKWRIIGVFNSVTKGDGSKENLVKIIRDESIGDYSWDFKQSGVGTSTTNYGSNDWTDSQLMMMLNPTDYLKSGYTNSNEIISSGSQQLYSKMGSYSNGTKGCKPVSISSGAKFNCTEVDFTSTGLKNDVTRNAIEEVVWNLGGINANDTSNASMFYTSERGMSSYNEHATAWTGKIGLMYPSDYGYATAGGSEMNRSNCLNIAFHNWNNSNECINNNYLLKSDSWYWTLSPSLGAAPLFVIRSDGNVNGYYVNDAYSVRPTIYLKSNITINFGTGSSDNPYRLNL